MPDPELIAELQKILKDEQIDIAPKMDTVREQGGNLWVDLSFNKGLSGKETIRYRIKPISELFNGAGQRLRIDGLEEYYHPCLMVIESAIVNYYRENPGLKDIDVIGDLYGLIKFIDEEPTEPLRQRIHLSLRICLSLNSFTRQEVLASLECVLRSARNHKAADGPTGYLSFIDRHLP